MYKLGIRNSEEMLKNINIVVLIILTWINHEIFRPKNVHIKMD